MNRSALRRYAWLSIAAAIFTIGLKLAAYFLTDSVGLLSDALESVVNLVAAVVALVALTVAARPPDEQHAYGHDKAEYFSSGVEGALILVAAFTIGYTAIERLLNPQPLEQVGIGLAVSVGASLINLGVSRVLLAAGRANESITLEADAKHLMTDVWTSVGVVAGVALVALSGYERLDPIVALLVAANIVYSGVGLLRRSLLGLLDTALDAAELAKVQAVFDLYASEGVQFHALRTRQASSRRFMTFHVLVPGSWTVRQGHDMAQRIEADLHTALPNLTITTHLEPVEDPAAWNDIALWESPHAAAADQAAARTKGSPPEG